MDPLSRGLYGAAAAVAGPLAVGAMTLKGRYGGPWRQRLGFMPPAWWR